MDHRFVRCLATNEIIMPAEWDYNNNFVGKIDNKNYIEV